jgi:hypothetical protein
MNDSSQMTLPRCNGQQYIFTSVPLLSMLEKATSVKKQKQPLCKLSDKGEGSVDKVTFGADRFTGSTHPQVALGSAYGGAF